MGLELIMHAQTRHTITYSMQFQEQDLNPNKTFSFQHSQKKRTLEVLIQTTTDKYEQDYRTSKKQSKRMNMARRNATSQEQKQNTYQHHFYAISSVKQL